MKRPRVLTAAGLGLAIAVLTMLPAPAATQKTVLAYSIKDARAFLWQIHYPQSTFISEYYGPCEPEPDGSDKYGCDRGRYNTEVSGKTCGDQALGRKEEAPGASTEADAEGGPGPATGDLAEANAIVKGNPVEVIHGLTLGRLGSSLESGGLASMYYVDQSGRRETEAHVESDGYVRNRHTYEERCAPVDAALESTYLDGPFNAHVLSRSDEQPSTYNMTAFTTAEGSDYSPDQSKESVTIVKLWEADGKVHGLLSSIVRALNLADQIKVDAVRSVIAFSSDGTPKGLVANARTEALGVTIGSMKLPSLAANDVIELPNTDPENTNPSWIGVLSPVVQVSPDGTDITIRAPGLFLAADTPLDQLPIPEDPVQNNLATDALHINGMTDQLRNQLCTGLEQGSPPQLEPAFDPASPPCRLTLGGHLLHQQVVYVAGAILDAGVGRVPEFSLPPLPPLPNLPPVPPIITPGTPPTFINNIVTVPGSQPVALPSYVTRQLAGSAWTLMTISVFTLLGLCGVFGRWSMRYPWARKVAHVPPFPALGWTYRAFLKG